ANASSATGLLHSNISDQQRQHSDVVHLMAEDFYYVDFKTLLPKLHFRRSTASGFPRPTIEPRIVRRSCPGSIPPCSHNQAINS
ncbi:hypothetical protein AMECASPLE_027476, partial [Ameca splendens]